MKYILVTGAFGGMGRATLDAAVAAGYTVIALDRRGVELREGVIPIEVDVTDEESVAAAFEAVSKITDVIYAVIHFAGVYRLDSLVEMTEKRFTEAFDVNLGGVYRINKAALPYLHSGSKIVITTSELAPLDPLPFTGIYAITKAALEKYAYSLRMELQLLGISVTVIRPGAVNTALLGDSTSELDKFVENTRLYSCNATRFKKIVDSVEARNVPPEKVARFAIKILRKKRTKHVYNLNRNPLLLLLNALPAKFGTFIIKMILKP